MRAADARRRYRGGDDTWTSALAPRTRSELGSWIQADLAAHGVADGGGRERRQTPVLRYQVLRRRAEYWHLRADRRPWHAPIAAALRSRLDRLGRQLDLEVALGTTGPGLALRGRGVTVVPGTRLGSHAILHAGVTVTVGPDGEPAVIGSYCELGRAARVEGAHLGDHVRVDADSVVVPQGAGADAHDLRQDVRLAGSPAQVVARPQPEARRDGRRTSLTAEQVQLARDLDRHARLSRQAIADAFWVTAETMEAYLENDGWSVDRAS